jgi:hypothetical protein
MALLCPHCDQAVLRTAETSGRDVTCPHCGRYFYMPPSDLPPARPAGVVVHPVEKPQPVSAKKPRSTEAFNDDETAVPAGTIYVAPSWMQPAGLCLVLLTVAATIAAYYAGSEGGARSEDGLLTAAMNPLCWITGILGIYWLSRASQSGKMDVCPHCGRRKQRVSSRRRGRTCIAVVAGTASGEPELAPESRSPTPPDDDLGIDQPPPVAVPLKVAALPVAAPAIPPQVATSVSSVRSNGPYAVPITLASAELRPRRRRRRVLAYVCFAIGTGLVVLILSSARDVEPIAEQPRFKKRPTDVEHASGLTPPRSRERTDGQSASGRWRVWTERSGRTFEAALKQIGFGGGSVVRLRLRTDGALYDFPIEVLSEADQQYVQDLSAMAARAPKRLLEHDPPDRATIVQGP